MWEYDAGSDMKRTQQSNPPTTNRLFLFTLAMVMVVNAMAYGVIIPLLYPYAEKFGLTPIGLSFLATSFSIAQFIATPILGRLSDKLGRKKVLVACMFGTSLSLAVFALAQSLVMIFIARTIDGVTGGTNSVAQAMIADTTNGKDRTKAFGILGAAFGVGMLVGPALGGLLSSFGLSAPFWFAAVLSLASAFLGLFVLPETLERSSTQDVARQPLFDVQKIRSSLMDSVIGPVLAIIFVSSVAMNAFIFGFQTFTNDVLQMSPTSIGILFSLFGLVMIIMQVRGIPILLDRMQSKRQIIRYSVAGAGILYLTLPFMHTVSSFAGVSLLAGAIGAPLGVVVSAMLSERTHKSDQGIMMGVSQSFTSVGQIVGPLLAGFVATQSVFTGDQAVGNAFFLTAFMYGLIWLVARKLDDGVGKVVDV